MFVTRLLYMRHKIASTLGSRHGETYTKIAAMILESTTPNGIISSFSTPPITPLRFCSFLCSGGQLLRRNNDHPFNRHIAVHITHPYYSAGCAWQPGLDERYYLRLQSLPSQIRQGHWTHRNKFEHGCQHKLQWTFTPRCLSWYIPASICKTPGRFEKFRVCAFVWCKYIFWVNP